MNQNKFLQFISFLKNTGLGFALGAFLVFGIFVFTMYTSAAWTNPTAAPIGGNVTAPIYVGTSTLITQQTKFGTFKLGTTTAPVSVSHFFVYNGDTVLASSSSGNVSLQVSDPSRPGVAVIDVDNNRIIGLPQVPIYDSEGTSRYYVDNSNFWGGIMAGNIYSKNTGNVGIGIASPSYKMQIQGNGSAYTNVALGITSTGTTYGPSLRLEATGASGRNYALYSGQASDTGGAGKFNIYDATANASRLTIDSAGNVGIGTVSPSNRFHVNGGMTWGGGTAAPYVYSGIDGTGLFIEHRGSLAANSPMRFQTSPSGNQSTYAQFFIDPVNGFSFISNAGGNSSNVGIGTVSPQLALDIRGNATIGAGMTAASLPWGPNANSRFLLISGNGTNPSDAVLVLASNAAEATGNNLGGVLFGQPTSGKTGVNAGLKAGITSWTEGAGGSVGGFGGYLRFLTKPDNGASDIGSYERMRITSSGNVGIGVTNPSSKLTVAGSIASTDNFNWYSQATGNNDPTNALMFFTTHISGGNAYTYFRIATPAYAIVAGDYLEFDAYCETSNPACSGGVEMDFSDGTYGRSFTINDQNGIGMVASDISAYASGRWYHRKLSLANVVGKTISSFDLVQESDLAGSFTTYYDKIIITNGASTLKRTIWDGGAPSVSALAYGANSNSYYVDGGYSKGLYFGNVTGPGERGIHATMGDNDFWAVRGVPTGSNAGVLEISTGDDSNEPVVVRQYSGSPWYGGTITRTAYLLDASGNTSFPGQISAGPGDLAEEFYTDRDYLPGTVLVMDDNGYKSSRASEKEYDQTVIGVVSEKPGLVIGRIEAEHKAPVVLNGVTRVNINRTSGRIHKGDMLTTSSVKGEAMKAAEPKLGTIIGKALEDDAGKGWVMALVNLK